MVHAWVLAAALQAAGGEVVARVDARAITAAAVSERMQSDRANGREATAEEALRALVDEAVLCGEAERRGLARKPEPASQIEAARRRLAAERLVQKEVVGAYRPDEAMLRQMYHGGADSVHLRLVVLASREQAEAALGRLRQGAGFADEAKASIDPGSKGKGGDLGTVARRELALEVAEVAFSAPIGEAAGPVPYGPGFAVVQAASRRVGTEEEFARRRAELEGFARDQARTQLPRHFAEQLRKKAGVKLDEAFLDGTGPRGTAEPAEAQHVLARVGKSVLRYADVLQDLGWLSRGQQSAHMSGPSVKKELAWKRVDRLLMEEEALARRFGEDPEVLARLDAERCLILGTAEAEHLRGTARRPTAADLEAYYQAHQEDFQRPAQRECAHVLAPTREAAEAVARKLAAGEPFDQVARHLSTDARSAGAGGALGTVAFDRLPELEKAEPGIARAMRDARPGEPTAPVQSKMGWHILRCGPVAPAGPIPPEKAAETIGPRLQSEASDQALRDGVATLRARARISVDEAALKRWLASAR